MTEVWVAVLPVMSIRSIWISGPNSLSSWSARSGSLCGMAAVAGVQDVAGADRQRALDDRGLGRGVAGDVDPLDLDQRAELVVLVERKVGLALRQAGDVVRRAVVGALR